MAITLDTFIANNTGKKLANPQTGTYPGQCVSLVQQVLWQCLDIPYAVRGNAKDWVNTIPAQGLGKVVTSLQKGDLLVWDARQGGGYGHIGVATGDGYFFQQNDYFNGHNGTSRKIPISWLGTPYQIVRMNKAYPTPVVTPPATGGGTSSSSFGGKYKLNTAVLNVRNKPSTSGTVMAQYIKGQTDEIVILDTWYTIADGYVWGRYTSGSGAVRYVAVGANTGAVDSKNDYLIKV